MTSLRCTSRQSCLQAGRNLSSAQASTAVSAYSQQLDLDIGSGSLLAELALHSPRFVSADAWLRPCSGLLCTRASQRHRHSSVAENLVPAARARTDRTWHKTSLRSGQPQLALLHDLAANSSLMMPPVPRQILEHSRLIWALDRVILREERLHNALGLQPPASDLAMAPIAAGPDLRRRYNK